MGSVSGKRTGWPDLFDLERADIMALHKTWIAFFLTFFVWFNMAPLATTILQSANLTFEQIKLLAICNVALTAPSRVIIGMLTDRFGPRRTFTALMVAMSLPCFAFAFSTTYTQMLLSRLFLSMVGAGFVVGIHMTSLWFGPRDIGFVQGVEAGFGNWGSSIAAVMLPVAALNVFPSIFGAASWRYAIALSGALMLAYAIYYWFAVTDGPEGWKKTHRATVFKALKVSSGGALVAAVLLTLPISGAAAVLVWTAEGMGAIGGTTALFAYLVIAAAVLYQAVQTIRANSQVIKGGGSVYPAGRRYRFTDVACLCVCYAACFGAELASVSMMPMFFERTWDLTPQTAGLLAALFPFTNFFARPLGGFITDRSPSRRASILICLGGMATGFLVMSQATAAWPLWLVGAIVFTTALFVVAAVGMTFAIVPLIKRSFTGEISGYVSAYGNVGAILFLAAYMLLSDTQFFLMLGGAAMAAFLFNYIALKEPEGAFAEEYRLSSANGRFAGGGN